MNNETANKFLGVMRGLISDYDSSHDKTSECTIVSANDDGTYNIALLSDDKTTIDGIVNGSPYTYKAGDSALIYRVDNSLSRSFIIGGSRAVNARKDSVSSVPVSVATPSVVSAGSSPSSVFTLGGDGTPSVILYKNGDVVSSVTITDVASANYAARSNYASYAGHASVADDFSSTGNIASALASKQNMLIFDNVPTASSTNPVTSGGIYNYTVANVGWESESLVSRKAGVATTLANQTSEQEVQASYGISANIDTSSAPTASIPTVQAVKDYTPVNAGEGISIANKTISLNAATVNALGGIKIGYSGLTERTYAVTLDGGNHAYVTVPWASTTWRPIKVNNTEILANTSLTALNLVQGRAISITGDSSGLATFAANIATTANLGVVQVGSTLSITNAGVVDLNLGHSNTWIAPQVFSNSVTMQGNLTVTGTTTHVNVTDLTVDKALITLANANGYARPLTVGAGLFVANCAGAGTNTNVALVFDNNGIAYVGRANLNTDGNVIVGDNPGLIPLMGRDAATAFMDGHLVSWSALGKKAVDSGYSVSNSISLSSTATIPMGSAVYDYVYSGYVSDVSWNPGLTSLSVTKNGVSTPIASTVPEQSADASYSIVSDIDANPTVSGIPTAAAVANYAASARHVAVAFTSGGNASSSGYSVNATYLVNTGVGYINGSFVLASNIARMAWGQVSSAANLSAWVGAAAKTYEGIGLDTTSNRDVSLRLVVNSAGFGTLYCSSVNTGSTVQFKMFC